MSATDFALFNGMTGGNRRTTPTTVGGATSGFDLSGIDLGGIDLQGALGQLMEMIGPLIEQLKAAFQGGGGFSGIFNRIAGGAGLTGSAVTNDQAQANVSRANGIVAPRQPAAGADGAAPEAGAEGGAVATASATLDPRISGRLHDAVVDGESEGVTITTNEAGQKVFHIEGSDTQYTLFHQTPDNASGFDAAALHDGQGNVIMVYEGMDLPDNADALALQMGDNPDLAELMKRGTGTEFTQDKDAFLSMAEGEVPTGIIGNVNLTSAFSEQHSDFVAFTEEALQKARAELGTEEFDVQTVSHSMGTRFAMEAKLRYGWEGTAFAPVGVPRMLLGDAAGLEGTAAERLAKINQLTFIGDRDDIAWNGYNLGDAASRGDIRRDTEVDVTGQEGAIGSHASPGQYSRGLPALTS